MQGYLLGGQFAPAGRQRTVLGVLLIVVLLSATWFAPFRVYASDVFVATQIMDINPGASPSAPDDLTNVNGMLFFEATDATHGDELWMSDGTAAGTTLVKDIYPGTGWYGPNSSFPDDLTDVNGHLFFVADDGIHGTELWMSDGTAAGTTLVKDVNPGSNGSLPRDLTYVNGMLFFVAQDLTHGDELWMSDGTTAGTTVVKDINPGNTPAGPNSSFPYDLTRVNDTLFFHAIDDVHGAELWMSDGTMAGTTMVKDIYPGREGSYPYELTNVDGTLFFKASDGIHGTEPWMSDGTAAGTTLVKDINPGSGLSWPNSSSPSNFTAVNGTIFFSAFDNINGEELWRSDGTAAGTTMVKDISPGSTSYGPKSSSPNFLMNVHGTLFFKAADDTHGYELWRSDGTAAGTTLVKDINPGSDGSFLFSFMNMDTRLFFVASDRTHGTALWTSDGTTTGTMPVADNDVALPPPGTSVTNGPRMRDVTPNLTRLKDQLVFVGTGMFMGWELWAVKPAQPPTFRSMPGAGTYGVPYSDTVMADGYPLPWMLYSGTLPPGLRVNNQAVTGTLTITGTPTLAGTFPVTMTAVNRAGRHDQPIILTVNPAPLSISANDVMIHAGDPIPVLTAAITGLVNGDTTTSVLTGTLATTATLTSPPGRYVITQGTLAASANYTLQFTPGTLTILSSDPTLTVTSAARGRPGSTFTFMAQHFTPGAHATVRIDDWTIGRLPVQADGTLVCAVTFPSSRPPGVSTLVVTEQTSTDHGSLSVATNMAQATITLASDAALLPAPSDPSMPLLNAGYRVLMPLLSQSEP